MSCVYMLHVKMLHRVISRRSRRVVAKKCTRKLDVRGQLMFCLSNLFLFLKCSSPSLLKLPNSEQMWEREKSRSVSIWSLVLKILYLLS